MHEFTIGFFNGGTVIPQIGRIVARTKCDWSGFFFCVIVMTIIGFIVLVIELISGRVQIFQFLFRS